MDYKAYHWFLWDGTRGDLDTGIGCHTTTPESPCKPSIRNPGNILRIMDQLHVEGVSEISNRIIKP